MTAKRSTLSLPKGKKATKNVLDDVVAPVGVFDLLLPAREFTVHHKVAELGQVSLTTEFLLRLLYSADGMDEGDVAKFFGFSFGELSFVVNEAEALSFVAREGGRLHLTDEGAALFKTEVHPQIFEVVPRVEKAGFDLIAFAPCEKDSLSPFERSLPEMTLRDEDLASKASLVVQESFRRFYSEIVGRRDRDASVAVRRSLYSVDDVVPGDRFSALVPIAVLSNVRRPSDPEPMLDAWRAGQELADRTPVVNSVATLLDSVKRHRVPEDDAAYQVLRGIAPEYLKEYVRQDDELSIDRFLRESAGKVGELRVDRKTVGLVGPLYIAENANRLTEAIEYTNRIAGKPTSVGSVVWLVPKIELWGAARALPQLLAKLGDRGKEMVGRDDAPQLAPASIAICGGKPEWYVQKAFDKILIRPLVGGAPASLEVFLIPGRVAAVLVHAPVGSDYGFSVPLGLLSFDETIVRRVTDYLEAVLPEKLELPGTGDLVERRRTVILESPAIQVTGDRDNAR